MAGFRSRSSIRRTDRRVDHHYEGSAVFSYIQLDRRVPEDTGPKNLRALAGRMRRAQTFRACWALRLRCALLGAAVQTGHSHAVRLTSLPRMEISAYGCGLRNSAVPRGHRRACLCCEPETRKQCLGPTPSLTAPSVQTFVRAHCLQPGRPDAMAAVARIWQQGCDRASPYSHRRCRRC